MKRIHERIREALARRIGFPEEFKTDLSDFLDEWEVADVHRCKNMLEHGGTTEGPADMPTFTSDAVASRPPNFGRWTRTSNNVTCEWRRTPGEVSTW